MRVVLDTNALLRCISSQSKYGILLDKLFDGIFELYYSNDILLEYEEKIEEFYSTDVAELILGALNLLDNVKKIDVHFQMNLITSDKDDNKFSDCAFAANANYLITNDKHFRVLQKIDFPLISTITLEGFYDKIVKQ